MSSSETVQDMTQIKPEGDIETQALKDTTKPAKHYINRMLTPKNLVVAFFLLVVVVSGAILFMAMVGMVRYKDKETKELWIEVCSQILNGVFTLAALVNHPFRIYDTVNYIRISGMMYPEMKKTVYFHRMLKRYPLLNGDMSEKEYLERVKRVGWILLLLNINCLTQYPITTVMWAYHPASTRPSFVVYTFLPLSFLSGTFAGVYQGLTQRTIDREGSLLKDNEPYRPRY
jgi:hypothetical protein